MPARKKNQRVPRPLYLGQWLKRLGIKPAELAKATGIGESYISLLISGKKHNPSIPLLFQIANFLGIPLQSLYEPPPSEEIVEGAAAIDPAVLARLLASRRH